MAIDRFKFVTTGLRVAVCLLLLAVTILIATGSGFCVTISTASKALSITTCYDDLNISSWHNAQDVYISGIGNLPYSRVKGQYGCFLGAFILFLVWLVLTFLQCSKFESNSRLYNAERVMLVAGVVLMIVLGAVEGWFSSGFGAYDICQKVVPGCRQTAIIKGWAAACGVSFVTAMLMATHFVLQWTNNEARKSVYEVL